MGSLHRFLMPMILLAKVGSINQSNSEGLCRSPWVFTIDLVGVIGNLKFKAYFEGLYPK